MSLDLGVFFSLVEFLFILGYIIAATDSSGGLDPESHKYAHARHVKFVYMRSDSVS